MEAEKKMGWGGVGWYDGDGDGEAVILSSGFKYN